MYEKRAAPVIYVHSVPFVRLVSDVAGVQRTGYGAVHPAGRRAFHQRANQNRDGQVLVGGVTAVLLVYYGRRNMLVRTLRFAVSREDLHADLWPSAPIARPACTYSV
jgi:hypothetical protein